MSVIGTSLPRTEDPRLLRGRGRFADDISLPGQLWARVVRSPVAHGRLLSVDTSRAVRHGAALVVTAADLTGRPVIPVRLPVPGLDLVPYLQPVLAADIVRYVGEPVAVVVAEDPYAAEDAADLVDVEVDELAPALDPAAAATRDAPQLFATGNVAADFSLGYGDVDAAFSRAQTVVEISVEIGRHTGMPLEPRALLASPDPLTGGADIFGMTKVPVFNQGVLASMLGMPSELIHVHAIDAGGGFGVRGEFYPEDFLVPWLALRLRRPVKWTEDRAEHLVAANHSRQQSHRIAAAFDADGLILGLRDDIVHDNGAYCRTHGITVPELTVAMLPGPYRIPAYVGRIRVVLTNKTPCGTYRAPGRFEGTTAREQLLDVAATQLGLDRCELRSRNLLSPEELPLRREMSTLGTEVVLDAANYPALFRAAMAEADRLGYPGEVREGRKAGRLRGLGLAPFLEKSGLGPQETAEVTIDGAGHVLVLSGATSFGQGVQTVLGQIAADALGVSPSAVSVVAGDTRLQPAGMGTWASRTTVVAGSAVHAAAAALLDRARCLAARLLEVCEADLELRADRVGVRGDPAAALSLAQIAAAATEGSSVLWPGEPAGLSGRGRFEVAHMTYPYGVHVAVVDVDPGTGQVRVLRYLVAYEVGRAVNPMLVAGQLRGGAAQGIGGALLEQLTYDEAGQPQATTFMTYQMPTAAETPRVDVLVTEDAPAPGNPLGVRGAGEGGVSAAGAAIASAVRDALGLTGTVGELPLTPDRILALAAAAAGDAAAGEAAAPCTRSGEPVYS